MSNQMQKPNNLIDSIQSEVSAEASPLLNFIVKNARYFFAGLIIFILIIAAYGVWSAYSKSKFNAAKEELGAITVLSASKGKMEVLAKYLENCPAELRTPALFELAGTAELLDDREKAVEAWQNLSENTNGLMQIIAKIGLANNLSKQGRTEEALKLLENLSASAPADAALVINSQLVDLAESMGQLDIAIKACEAIINSNSPFADKNTWQQRAAYLRLKQKNTKS